MIAYLFQLGSFPITLPDNTTQQDGYSLFLSRLVHKSLVNETVSLRMDCYYGVLTRIVFAVMQDNNVTCQGVLAQGPLTTQQAAWLCKSTEFGWDTTNNAGWYGLRLWVEACNKTTHSAAFATLQAATGLSPAILQSVLYTAEFSISYLYRMAMVILVDTYQCAGYCTYDQLFLSQWGRSTITLNPPAIMVTHGVQPCVSMQTWFPDHYRVPVEWLAVTQFPFPVDPAVVLSYDSMLNPMVLKEFFNSYLARNLTATCDKFGLPSFLVNMLYNYFLKLIPGYGLFSTYTVDQWLTGAVDPFIVFINNMTVYEGGDPSISSVQRMATLTNDQPTTPQHIMYTGKDDTSQTRQYYAYYGHHNMDMYWPGYNASAPGANSWQYYQIWNGSNPILGSDGGQFGTRMQKTDEPYVFISSVLRWFKLKYLFSYEYHGLNLYRYVMDNALMDTAAENPENYYFYQEPWGLKGYMNITTQFSGPVFVNMPHCFGCDADGVNMIEYYSYPDINGSQVQIYPSQEADQPFADIEPETGAGVRLVLVFAANIGLYKDYFFPDFFEVSPGAPLYIPYYILKRSVNYTEHQVNRVFGTLMLARKLETVFRITGLIVGAVLILSAFLLLAYLVKAKKQSAPEYTEMIEEERPPSIHSSEHK